jgi:hypothetical protein
MQASAAAIRNLAIMLQPFACEAAGPGPALALKFP